MAQIDGTSGADTLVGGIDPDQISGSGGNDVVAGLAGDDTLTGGDGYDLITAGEGNDSIDGGTGVDILALTGQFGDYSVEEIAAPTNTAPGTYRITDQRAEAPEGTDTFTGIEKLRFEIGGELSLADALDRAPTGLALSFLPDTGPEVNETSRPKALVAVLSGVDPDPAEAFTFDLVDDGGGRFVIEGDLLVVARSNAFDFATNASHSVTIRVTDGAGNQFHKQVTVDVIDDITPFTTISAVLPAGSSEVGLWELDGGGFIISWRGTVGGSDGWFARRVDDSGASVDPQAPDSMLMATAVPAGQATPQLLGVDDEGVAVFVQNFVASSYGNNTTPDKITWVDAVTGEEVRSKTIDQSISTGIGFGLSTQADQYFFDDGYVGYELRVEDNISSSADYFGSQDDSSQTALLFEKSAPSNEGEISGFSASSSFVEINGPDNPFEQLRQQGTRSETSGRILDITEDGRFIYSENSSSLIHSSYSDHLPIPPIGFAMQTATLDVALKGSAGALNLGGGQTSDRSLAFGGHLIALHSVGDAAILDVDRFAYIGSVASGRKLVLVTNDETVELELSENFAANAQIQALGTDRYLLTGQTSGGATHAQVVNDVGDPTTELLTFAGSPKFTLRDDGTFVVFTTQASSDPQQPGISLNGQSLELPAVSVEADGGVFADSNGDGDLDFSGTILIGMQGGLQSLRLENGVYEMTDATITVTNATAFADIGEDTTTPLFKGSFTLDRATGIASGFSTTPLGAGIEPLKIAGLTTIYRGLTVRKDGAAFTASFQLPTLLFDGGPMFDLNSPNALLIKATGPELEGFEIPIGALDVDWFGLFEAEGKNLKVRYDGAQNELAFSGELKVTSDIIDGLGGLTGIDDVELTFKGLKVKDGKIDFEGKLSAKEWELGPIALKDVNLAIKIDDDVVVSVGVAAGVELPFEQLTGLSFAGEVLNPPLSLNKLGLTAKTEVRLPHGFFLDAIGATLDHLAGSPQEPTPVPTSFTGLLGIGWGPKVPSIELPDALGIDEIEGARLVNIELTATTDWTTSIAGAGKINLYKDELGKHEGSITWNFQQSSFTFAGSLDYLSGIITGAASARFSELGFTVNGTGTIALPNASLFGPLAGLNIGSVSILAQVLADSNPTNDVVAGWGTVSIPIIGSQTVGIKLDLNDGNVSLILGANDVPETSSFDVLGTEDWLMISAAWNNLVAGPVLTQVRTPEGTFIQEADYAASGITIIDLYTGPTKKTIVIDTPRAGNWDLQIIDPSGLQNVDYSGFTPNQAVDITVGDVDLVLGATTGQIDASLVGADPGTDVTFFADTDGAGLDGFALGAATRDTDGAFMFDFGALGLAGGLYHIYAVADDGMNAPAFDYGGTFIVAQRPTDITLDADVAPVAAGAAAVVAETALPGGDIAILGAVNPDLAETHAFALIDDAGGRFAIMGDTLVVGTGAPFDFETAATHQITVRATTSQGLAFDETITIEVGNAQGAPNTTSGNAERDVLLGANRNTIFFAVVAEDTVIGRGAVDVLYLNGNRADFELILDADGSIAGPVRAFLIPDGIDPGSVPPNALDPVPPYLLLNDLRGTLGPIITSGIEILQFRDARIALAADFNTAPDAAVDGPYAAAEDTVLIVAATDGVLANDTDTESDTLTAALVTGPAHGHLTLNPDGSFTYTPDANYFGSDSFTYKANDGAADSNTAMISLTVGASNDAPVIGGDGAVTVAEGGSVVIATADLTANDPDNTDGQLVFTVTGTSHGIVQLNGSAATTFTKADLIASIVTFQHDGGEADGSFAVSLSDGAASPVLATIATIVDPHGNDAPVVSGPLTLAAIDEDSGPRLITQAELLDNADDSDGPSLTAIDLQILSGLGTLVDNGDQTWSYTPAANDDTSVTFSYQVTDGTTPVSTSAKLFINPVSDSPPIETGTSGDDSFAAPAGTRQFDGLGGIDTMTFGFRLVDANVTYDGNKVIVDGPSSQTILTGFERFVFTDGTVDNNDGNWLVDDLFYYSGNHDVWNAHVDADGHYNTFGWHENRDPDAFFSTRTYLSANPDVQAAGVNPLDHWHGAGWTEGRVPSIMFDPRQYLAANPDVAAAHVDPLAHFLQFGAQEGRQPFAPSELIAFNGFDFVYYLQHNPDVAVAGVDPFQHFQTTGWHEGRNPNALFDTGGYLATYTDVAGAGVNPLDHYHVWGWQEGRDPSLAFDTASYLAANPDVAAAHIDPLWHFLHAGIHEGRIAFADGAWG